MSYIGAIVIFIFSILLSASSFAESNLGNLSISDLKNISVTSVSKHEESAFEAASAIHVITAEDIRRSGALSIPEALRMVPGINVARIDSNKWAIASRGFNSQYGEKMLVLIDGRTVYSPVFSGVLWDIQDVVMEDIKRIEVIRGPGASLWGANAVNGVINIITKDSSETQGGLVSAHYGNSEAGYSNTGRYGGKINDSLSYRVYAKYFNNGSNDLTDGTDAMNEWYQYRSGYRLDWNNNLSDKVTFQGDIFYTDKDRRTIPISKTPEEIFHEDTNSGGNILGKWTHKQSETSEYSLQFYYDREKRDHILLNRTTDTYDLDFQHNISLNDRNEFTWGLGYRHYSSKFDDTPHYDFTSNDQDQNLYSTFVQNKFAMIPSKLYLTVGSKFEHNDFTGFEMQPNARLSWLVNDNNTVWGSVSRAVRTPSIAENDISTIVGKTPFGLQKLVGNTELVSENLIAYELGYRSKITNSLSLDSTVFYNDYTDLRNMDLDSIYLIGSNVIIPSANDGKGKTYGFEISGIWDINSNWRLVPSYSLIHMDLNIDKVTDEDEGKTPKSQFTLRSHYNITDNWELDNMLYYVDALSSLDIPSYVRFDARLGWNTPVKNLALDLVGQNLLDVKHREFSAASNSPESPPEIGRTFFVRLKYTF